MGGDGFPNDVIALIPMMRAYAMSLTRSRPEADDLVQDTLVRAWRFRQAYQPGTNLKAWLYKILRNIFYSNRARRPIVVQDVDGRLAAQLACTPDQEWQVQFGELLRSLDQLTPDTRDALLLIVVAGLSYEEAAEVCSCAVGTVKSRVSRARCRLAELLDYDLPAARRQPARPPPQMTYS
jgi:RNA polymerase sigma-70 factor (ECF subfamily)